MKPRFSQLQEIADEAAGSGEYAPAVAALRAAEAMESEAKLSAEAATWAQRPKSDQLRRMVGLAIAKGSFIAAERLLKELDSAEEAERYAASEAARAIDEATPDAHLITSIVDPIASLPRALAVEALRQLAARLHLPATYADGSAIEPLGGE